MTIWIDEQYKSRDASFGFESSGELIYYTGGEPDEEVAYEYVLAHVPSTYRTWPLRGIDREQLTLDLFKWTAKYSISISQTNQETATLNFQIGGGTIHITNSLGTPDIYIDDTLVPTEIDYGGAIGVELNDDGTKARVRGVEVFAPLLEYSYGKLFDTEDVTDAFIGGIYDLAGKVNNATFYNRPAGSVLFKGARGAPKGSYQWEITFDFAYSPNAESLVVGNIEGIEKTGWQYLDVLYVPAATPRTTKGLSIMQPGQVTVHTVYQEGDFSALGVGTA